MNARARPVAFALVSCAALALACDESRPARVITGPYGGLMTYGLSVHETFVVQLESGVGGGYVWQAAGPLSANVAARGEPTASKGTTAFTFEAVAPGEGLLRFEYVRPSQPDAPPLRTFEVALRVN